jgi:hypothetical protein
MYKISTMKSIKKTFNAAGEQIFVASGWLLMSAGWYSVAYLKYSDGSGVQAAILCAGATAVLAKGAWNLYNTATSTATSDRNDGPHP